MIHEDDRLVVIEAFGLQFPGITDLTLSVYQCLHGVCTLETNMGRGWKGAGRGSNNVGAVQGGRPPCDPGTSFQYVDTHPNPDGTSTPYTICFKRYPTLVAGVADVARIMFREVGGRRPALEAATEGDLYGVSAAMRAQGYYEGFGRTQAERIANHHRALESAVRRVAVALGEPMPGTTHVPKPTIRRGSRGAVVKEWQQLLNYDMPDEDPLVLDGMFGPLTERRTMAWQRANGLQPDGIVGPKTWGKANG